MRTACMAVALTVLLGVVPSHGREAQLQAEMDRMARGTRNPSMLRELFAALGDDPA